MSNVILISPEQLQDMIRETLQNEIAPLLQRTPETKQDPDLLTRKQTASLLGVTLPTLHAWTKQGKITGYRIGTTVRYKKDELHQCLAKINTGNN